MNEVNIGDFLVLHRASGDTAYLPVHSCEEKNDAEAMAANGAAGEYLIARVVNIASTGLVFAKPPRKSKAVKKPAAKGGKSTGKESAT